MIKSCITTRIPSPTAEIISYRDEGPGEEDEREDGDHVHRERLPLGLEGNLMHLGCTVHHLDRRRLSKLLERFGHLNGGMLVEGLKLEDVTYQHRPVPGSVEGIHHLFVFLDRT